MKWTISQHDRLMLNDETPVGRMDCKLAVADLRRRGMRAPLGVQILSISCSFWENLVKAYVGAPLGGLVLPPRRNPRSVTG